MSLNVTIKFKEPKQSNYFLEHPYIYDGLSEKDEQNYREEHYWTANITHNLSEMASHVLIELDNLNYTTLYYVCWHPKEIGIKTVRDILPLLIKGIHYMIDHRKELVQYDALNGWGTYNSFMKFLLNYKQACEDNDPDCLIEVSI